MYRSANAVVTYGPHVSDYVRRRGARNVHVAPQSVDNAFWRASPDGPPGHPAWPAASKVRFLFVGRPGNEKGLQVLLTAWRTLAVSAPGAALVLAGVAPADRPNRGLAGEYIGAPGGVSYVGRLAPAQLRNFYGAADVLVLPSIPTRTFREPWGLVVNEAFNQQLPVVVSDAVGAAAGGLVRDGVNGLIVPAADPGALAEGLRRLAKDANLRASMGRAGASDVLAYTHEAWADGFSQALASLNLACKNVGHAEATDSVA
jgi:glycosyltransferase involved in cell wall biosynthesis